MYKLVTGPVAGKRWIPTYNVTPTLTYASRWQIPAFYHRRRPIDYSHLHGGTYSPRKVLLTFFYLKKIFENFFGPFPCPCGTSSAHFRIPLLTLIIPIFSLFYTLFYTFPVYTS